MADPLNDILVREENRIGPHIYKKTLNTSVWNKLVKKETWPEGLSDTIQVLTMERNLPANIDTWSALAPNDESNNCVPVADVIPSGQTLRSYNLQQKAVESQDLCLNDLRNAFKASEQIKALVDGLTNTVKYIWKRYGQVEYTRISEHKIVAAEQLPESPTAFPALAATSTLTQKILDKIYTFLLADSADTDGGSLGMQDGAPQFILVTDMETSNAIKREEQTNNAILWNAKRVPELLAPLGIDTGIRGFYHTIDSLPRRFNFTGGAWVEVMPYLEAAATKGVKRKINLAWFAAPFQDSYVFLPSVFSFMVPDSIASVGSGTSFDPQSYVGDFKWKNIIDRELNPDGNIGYFRAVLQVGSKPVHPEFGYVIRHKRCPGDIGLQECAAVEASTFTPTGDQQFLV